MRARKPWTNHCRRTRGWIEQNKREKRWSLNRLFLRLRQSGIGLCAVINFVLQTQVGWSLPCRCFYKNMHQPALFPLITSALRLADAIWINREVAPGWIVVSLTLFPYEYAAASPSSIADNSTLSGRRSMNRLKGRSIFKFEDDWRKTKASCYLLSNNTTMSRLH